MMDSSIDAITNNIQLALAPVFLLTAVATMINAISTRLARTVDRMRAIQRLIYQGEVKDQDALAHLTKEAREAKIRGRLCTAAIFFVVLSGVFISLTVLELFFFQAGAVRSLQRLALAQVHPPRPRAPRGHERRGDQGQGQRGAGRQWHARQLAPQGVGHLDRR